MTQNESCTSINKYTHHSLTSKQLQFTPNQPFWTKNPFLTKNTNFDQENFWFKQELVKSDYGALFTWFKTQIWQQKWLEMILDQDLGFEYGF